MSREHSQHSAEADRPFEWIGRNVGTPLVDLEDKEALRRLLDEPS